MTREPPAAPWFDALARSQLARRVAPLSLAFVLDLVDIGRHRDVLDSLLFGAILMANTEPLAQDPLLAQAYADVHAVMPDDLRRPVSINAVAQSLRLPFETARRRIRRMARTGDMVITPRGVYIPAAAVTNAHFMTIVMRRHERLRQFYADLLAADALPQPAAADLPPAATAPLRLTNRAVAEYMLRIADSAVARMGDPAATLILAQLASLNAQGFTEAEFGAWSRDPVAAGRPVRIATLAGRLRFSPETTRRHILALEGRGFCVRVEAGLLATAPAEARPLIVQVTEENLAHVHRLFARLRHLGVLAAWEAAAPLAARSSG